jgi:hypothetical protein
MRILGIEFAAKNLNYVLISYVEDTITVVTANRLTLTDTRTPDSLRSFHDAVSTLLNGTNADRIGVKYKPESGQMSAGAAALKMEGILLAIAPCDVDFVSGQRVNAEDQSDELKAYQQPAYKVAQAALKKLLV